MGLTHPDCITKVLDSSETNNEADGGDPCSLY
jgi:hypothetical protein